MDKESQTCDLCLVNYNTIDRIPRILINCGHNLCSHCLRRILLDAPGSRKCPFDNLAFSERQDSLDRFPLNFALLALLEGKSQKICPTHAEELTLLCFQDKTKICSDCAIFGDHKGHNIKKIKELKAKGIKTKGELEDSLMKFEKNQLEKGQDVEEIKEGFFSKVGSQFEEIKKLLRTKELEWKREVENLFERTRGNYRGSLLRIEAEKVLEEINQACEKEENLSILEQDFSSIITTLLQAQVTKEEISKISDETSSMMNCLGSFLTRQAKSIKNFQLSKSKTIPEQYPMQLKDLQQQLSSKVLVGGELRDVFISSLYHVDSREKQGVSPCLHKKPNSNPSHD